MVIPLPLGWSGSLQGTSKAVVPAFFVPAPLEWAHLAAAVDSPLALTMVQAVAALQCSSHPGTAPSILQALVKHQRSEWSLRRLNECCPGRASMALCPAPPRL